MAKSLRVFISSPGDVPDERLRAALVIDKLGQEFRRYFTFEVIRWEYEPLLASGHFQDALDPPSQADIVILILWSRLGTPLPDKTAVRAYHGIDGRVPVTGTEWEFEDALASARARGAPDLLAFRNTSPAPIDPLDTAARARSNAQLDALDTFWRRHFADRGVFLSAFDEYSTLEAFATRLEQSLRALIERRVKAMPAETPGAATTWFGPPFRGLQAYGFEHAPIFFGRDAVVAKAAEQLATNGRTGTAFLLVSGASGSGKSSLVQAALVPRLMKPQRIEGAAFLRRMVFRPGGSNDPLLGLVEALTRSSGEDGVGLPELLAPGQTAADLAVLLRQAVDKPGFVFAAALGRLTEAGRKAGELLAFEEAKLILVIDQFEELFTAATISPDDRTLFVRLLGGLARSGAVWVVATLRADFWHRAAGVPELLALAQGLGRIDVAAPSPAELAEMIRKPAQAAGLAFETHPVSGIGLDAVLAEDAAAAPGVLPLLSFTLDALYAEDIGKHGGNVLTYATYEALGGLEGAIAKRADEIVAALPDAAQAAVPRVLRALTTIAGGSEQTVVARVAPLASFAPGSPARAVVDAFTESRLLVASQDGTAPTVRLAHEALISRWERARQQLATDRRDLETRAVLEQQLARWSKATGTAQRQLLLRDPDLANAIDLSRRWGDELDDDARAFIAASRQRARLRQRLTAAAAAVFAVVAVAASVLGVVAYQAQQRAEQTLHAATETANGLVFDLAQHFRHVTGVPASVIKDILDRARALQDQLTQSGQVTPALRHSQVSALIAIAATLLDQGETEPAYEAADRARKISQDLLKAEPTSLDWRHDLMASIIKMADILVVQGKLPDALKLYHVSIAIAEQIAKAAPGNLGWQRDVAVIDNKIGDVLVAQGQLSAALTSYRAGLVIGERIVKAAPDSTLFQHDLTASHNKLGNVLAAQGNLPAALAEYQTSVKILERLAKSEPNDTQLQRDLSISYAMVGDVFAAQGKLPDALKFYQDALEVSQRLAEGDRGNAEWQRDLSVNYDKVGDVQVSQGRWAEALKSFQAGLAIAERLAKTDPRNAGWQRDVAVSDNKVGDVLALQGKWSEARTYFQAALVIVERLAKSDPSNADWRRDRSISENKIGDTMMAEGKWSEALKHYRVVLAIRQALVKKNPDNSGWQRDLSLSYFKIGSALEMQGKLPDALVAYRQDLAIIARLTKADPGNARWQRDLSLAYNSIGGLLVRQGNLPEALTAYRGALTATEQLAKADPDSAPTRHDLAAAHTKIADVLRAQGNLPEALKFYRASLAIEVPLAKANPDNTAWQRDVALSCNSIGDMLAAQRNWAEALESYRQGLAVVERLTKIDPANTVWQRDAAISRNKIGDVLLAQHDPSGAAKSYQAAVAICDRLVTLNSKNTLWQTDLVISLFKLSLAAPPGEARAALARALTIVEALAREGKLTVAQQIWPKLIRDALAKLPPA